MRRTWRSLKLGMKSLLLHKLRSGLTVLGIVFGVAAVISMLAVGEGSSRKAQRQFADMGADNIMIRSIKPTDESQSSGGGGRRSVLTYGLTYADYERILATVPTIKKALPIREIRKQIRYLNRYLDGRVVGTTQRLCRVHPPGDRQGPLPHQPADNEKYKNYAVLAFGYRQDPLPPRGPDRRQSIKIGSAITTPSIGVTRRTRVSPRASAPASRPRTTTRTCISP